VEVVVQPLVAIAGQAARWYVTEASAMVLGEDTGGEDSCAALEVRERRRERVQSSRKHL